MRRLIRAAEVWVWSDIIQRWLGIALVLAAGGTAFYTLYSCKSLLY